MKEGFWLWLPFLAFVKPRKQSGNQQWLQIVDELKRGERAGGHTTAVACVIFSPRAAGACGLIAGRVRPPMV